MWYTRHRSPERTPAYGTFVSLSGRPVDTAGAGGTIAICGLGRDAHVIGNPRTACCRAQPLRARCTMTSYKLAIARGCVLVVRKSHHAGSSDRVNHCRRWWQSLDKGPPTDAEATRGLQCVLIALVATFVGCIAQSMHFHFLSLTHIHCARVAIVSLHRAAGQELCCSCRCKQSLCAH